MRRPIRDDLEFARELHAALPVACRYLPGNHDIGDNPTAVGPAPSQPATERDRQAFRSHFGEDRWRFDAAGWCFIGLNSLIMNTGLASEAEQFDWLASQLSGANGKPVALFLHKPLFLNSPDDPELAATRDPLRAAAGAQPPGRDAAARSICGWSPAATCTSAAISPIATSATSGRRRPASSFPTGMQPVIGIKETGLVEYRFQPDSFEVRHIRAPGQIDIDLDELIGAAARLTAPGAVVQLTPCPARPAPAACRNWRPSAGP